MFAQLKVIYNLKRPLHAIYKRASQDFNFMNVERSSRQPVEFTRSSCRSKKSCLKALWWRIRQDMLPRRVRLMREQEIWIVWVFDRFGCVSVGFWLTFCVVSTWVLRANPWTRYFGPQQIDEWTTNPHYIDRKSIPEIFRRIPLVSFSKSWIEVHTWNCLHFGCVFNRKCIVKKPILDIAVQKLFWDVLSILGTTRRYRKLLERLIPWDKCFPGHFGFSAAEYKEMSQSQCKIGDHFGKHLSRLLSGQTVFNDTQWPALTGRTVQTKTREVPNRENF